MHPPTVSSETSLSKDRFELLPAPHPAQDLEPQVQALQEGKVVEITAEPGLKSLGIHGFLKRIAGPETVGLPWVSRQIPTKRGPPFGGTLTLH